MFIVHWSNWGPGGVSGMFESCKDQIKYERKEGHRSEFGDCRRKEVEPHQVDDWLKPISWEEATGADVWVLHAKYPDGLDPSKCCKLRVAVLHGPTEHLVLKEWSKGGGDLNLHINLLWREDATICINTHEYDIMKLYDEKVGRCHYIPNSIDLERMENIHPWNYVNRPAIISCDTPRIEKLPLHIIWSIPYIRKHIPSAHLNVYSLLLEPIAQWRSLFVRSYKRRLESYCENIQLANRDLRPFQAGADIGFNNNYSGIASRVTMEMQALGTPVIAYNGEYTPYHARIFDLHSIAEQVKRVWDDMNDPEKNVVEETKQYARDNYDRSKEVKKYVKLYGELLTAKGYTDVG